MKLDISGNRISVLPNEMRKMKGLVDFKLSDNPLTSPPASVSIRKRFIRSFSLKKEGEKESDIFSLTHIHLHSFLRPTDFNNPYTILLHLSTTSFPLFADFLYPTELIGILSRLYLNSQINISTIFDIVLSLGRHIKRTKI